MPELTPTKVSSEVMLAYVANVKARVRSADPGQVSKGLAWYEVAHDLACFIGDSDVRMGAGLLAALSVNKPWTINKTLARDAANGWLHGHFGFALDNARAILEGQDPALVLPDGSKTWNFYRAILDPHDPDVVVIDRHVHDAIVGEVYGNTNRGLSNRNRYATLALAVKIAAFELNQDPEWAMAHLGQGITPNDVQAILWVTQIDMVRGMRTRTKNQGE